MSTLDIIFQQNKLHNFKFLPPFNIKLSSRISYSAWLKLKVVLLANENGNRAAGRQFNVDEKYVRRWRAQENTLRKAPRKKRALWHGIAAMPGYSTLRTKSHKGLQRTIRFLNLV